MRAWTQRLRISWRSTLGFFEGRYDVLREIERRELLYGFRVTEQRIAVRLGDPAHFIAFAPGRIELSVFQPDADRERLRMVLPLLVERLDVGAARLTLDAQWLDPLELDYDDARNRALARHFPELITAEAHDFAFMLESRRGSGTRWILDIGVLKQSEMPARLSREESRLGPRDPESPPSIWPLQSLPEVALYVDGTFELLERVADASVDNVLKQWESLTESAEELVTLALRRVDPRGEA
ncbi:MAG TPA: hypothetical protein VGW75_05505 [Solirubrobacteraceae bacterium]|nr:hypothetical protein [Solirubrobacteraceae bacterium]